MYSVEERDEYFKRIIENFQSNNLFEGVVQLGSGVKGYNDAHSDIDLMASTYRSEDVDDAKQAIYELLTKFNPVYIKEKQFTQHIFLFIVFMENSLELNISVLPSELLNVKSPLWKVVVDKSGVVSRKMHAENEVFQNKPVTYEVNIDLPFEFAYCALNVNKELKRNNLIYALKMLERMREYVLLVQAMNESKKLHQFKAYGSLDPSFIEAYLSTYPDEVTVEKLTISATQLKELFADTVDKNPSMMMDERLYELLK
ncbi:aminoglycoside 6-adenylyltransferase [Sporosarcina thermotolerans]|uniref:Aminoglycoside 6-adenylyltransferase n=1 Tax=Sporosarcina thermotolerans TaxID=633404 RepID=A0AAW9ACF4_9BACL|nr:aminoglycoside 6-adenylyltransferase [Sporosarcina thermotolerans]MDW0116816.1 aminoglycoside 6-adenylyltransferase [Sporosarcina thermotolerans]WHT48991.1 aminoglycoside 6-adenylyltransferase [Sporosarcina thermotolerans]